MFTSGLNDDLGSREVFIEYTVFANTWNKLKLHREKKTITKVLQVTTDYKKANKITFTTN